MEIDENILSKENLGKLEALNNPKVLSIVEEYVKLCKPAKVTILTDSPEDKSYIRQLAIKNGEEKTLATEGHTVHFDGYYDQGRDKEVTKVLVSQGTKLSSVINTGDRETCLLEIFGIMDGVMKGREMFVKFYCLGPLNSKFSICALQLTDSAYVLHSEDMMYRPGYEQFKKLKGSQEFFHFVHSAGELDERGCSKDVANKRIYIDIAARRVLTCNNQYAGNSVGLKKLALRLAIDKASSEDWLCEHMFIMGVKPEKKRRTTYVTGAFPSACGKTSTAMISGQTIIGDDIAYIKPGKDGRAYAVNIEQGIFGIIQDVNPVDDPVIYKAITTPRELIFSNILMKDKVPYWLGMGKELPKDGENYCGRWTSGMKGPDGKEVLPAHKNARYTVRISELENADKKLDDPKGVPVRAFIYGGRDSDTSVPVCQSFSWSHGVFLGSCLESETTAATIGQEGVRTLSPMANMDFLAIPLGAYINNHLKFGEKLDYPPLVFATNYFLRKEGKYMNDKVDKKVWLLWMEGRIHEEYDAIETPIGLIPRYEDIRDLFMQIFKKDFTKEDYVEQFSIRLRKFLQKLERIEMIYKAEEQVPEFFQEHMEQNKERLKEAIEKFGKDVVSPFEFETAANASSGENGN